MTTGGSPPRALGVAIAGAMTLGALLLFHAELVLAKWVLPWFGGTASVWAVNLVFYQVVLLLGYVYAERLARAPDPRRQQNVHGALLLLALALVASGAHRWSSPITPGDELRPTPALAGPGWMLLVLGLSAGVPAFALGTTAPLLQSWFARAYPDRSPYPLYALSNAGSLLGVVSFPLLEPRFATTVQGNAWGLGFLAYVLLVAYAAAGQARAPGPPPRAWAPRSAGRDVALWVALGAIPSAALQAFTAAITVDLAPVPLLWVVPLVLYLLSFVWAFGARPARAIAAGRLLAIVSAPLAAWSLLARPDAPLAIAVAAFLGLVFASGCVAHGELARLRPAPERLGIFYVAIAAGGAAGSSLVALVAPAVLRWPAEVPVLVVATFALAAGSWLAERPRRRRAGALALAGAALAAAIALTAALRGFDRAVLVSHRDFYGSFRVLRARTAEDPRLFLTLQHGSISHGMQYEDPRLAQVPTRYYTERSGIGRVLLSHPRRARGEPLRVGIVGLGVGTLAAYGRPGDDFRFYELDPAIAALSAPPRPLFSYLAASAAHVSVAIGDGRLALQDEAPQGFDVLVLDAFSSDSIPVHLLTREAFASYRRHLRGADAVVAFHVSNRYLDLVPTLGRLAREEGFACVVVTSAPDASGGYATQWVLLCRDPSVLSAPRVAEASRRPWGVEKARAFTDDHSGLLHLIRR